ncbi:MAG TPA: hypothetical protein VKN18_32315 [Blastocatellia bacterium]|nr:hypothetical protein [Blastocatellia bacterium]
MAERPNVAIQQRVPDEVSGRSAVAIRNDIAAKRESISETVDKLGEKISQTFDWREYVAQYPAIALGLSAGCGFLVAGIFKRNPTPKERILDAIADLTEEAKDRVQDAMMSMVQKRLLSTSTLKATITAMATKAALDFLKQKLLTASASSPRQRTGSTSHAKTVY